MTELRVNCLKKRKVIFWIIFATICIANVYWFFPLRDKVFLSGDDVRLVNLLTSTSNLFRCVFMDDSGIYRPVSYFLFSVITRIFGTKGLNYFYFNILLNCIISWSIFRVSYKISEEKKLLNSCLASVIYVFSIYSYYGVTQLYGLMEHACVLCAVWLFYFIFSYLKERKQKYYNYSVICFSLMVFSHERFIAIVGVFILLNLFLAKNLTKEKKMKNIIISVLPVVVFIFIKVVIFGAPLFVGTGQVAVKFSMQDTISHILQSIASIFGITYGPSYLFGITFVDYTNTEKILTILNICILVFLFICFVVKVLVKPKEKRQTELNRLFVFIFLMGASIIAYSISGRIEMREIFVPFVFLLLYAIHCLNMVFVPKKKINVLIIVFLVTYVNNCCIFAGNIDELFFMRAMRLGKTAYEKTMGQEVLDSSYKFYIENNNELIWAMLLDEPQGMFYQYGYENIDYEIFDRNDSTLVSRISNDLQNGKKARILFIDGSIKTEVIKVEGLEQLDNIEILVANNLKSN